MKVTKEQAAFLQLCDAIALFNKERYISAITLAAPLRRQLTSTFKLSVKCCPFSQYTFDVNLSTI